MKLIHQFNLLRTFFVPGNRIYLLEIVEQPQQCRMSGLADKDRRPIDPAPIVKLVTINCFHRDSLKGEDDENDELESPFYVLHASLWSEDMTTQFDLVEGVYPYTVRFLMGSLVSSPSILYNLQDERGIYFAFPDLSVRMTGIYRLKFSLLHLAMNKVITEVFTNPFIVYSAKSYPGMKESSSLSKHLARQGLKLTVRSQSRGKRDSQ